MSADMDQPKPAPVKKKPALTLAPARTASLGVALVVLLSAAAGFGGGWIGAQANREKALSGDAKTSQKIVSSESELISKIARDVGPSVVSVNVTAERAQRSFFGTAPVQQQSAGTGFIISADGLIVTNRHVVSDSGADISVTLSDGTELTEVEIVGRTNSSDPLDVAFLKVKDKDRNKGKDFKPVKLGDSSSMEVGDKVVAIGNALGQFQNTVTTGIVSGYGRDLEASDETGADVEVLQNLFQTDAAINQGNSGGPLVNMSGEVIGVNTAVAGQGAENIGFALPINDIKGLIKSVLASGTLVRPYLGVHYISLNDEYAKQLQIETKRGAYIGANEGGEASIIAGSPAEKAGLKEKDIIIKVGNDTVDEKHSLTSLIGRHEAGEEVTLTIVRDGKQQTVKAKLEAAPNQ